MSVRAPFLLVWLAACDSGSLIKPVTDTDPVDDSEAITDSEPRDSEPVDTDPVDTDPIDTDDTDPVDTDPVDTDDTDPVDTDDSDTDDTDPVDTDDTDDSDTDDTDDTDPVDTDDTDDGDPDDTDDTDPVDTDDTDPVDTDIGDTDPVDTDIGDTDLPPPVDADSDGYPADVDCNDDNNTVNPGATERCNAIDDDCDDLTDDEDDSLVGAPWWYPDEDQDQFTRRTDGVKACLAPSEKHRPSTSLADCNDHDRHTFPGAAAAESATACMTDADGDDYGDENTSAPVVAGTDCHDDDATIHPEAEDRPYDGTDSNCDGASEFDIDGDGFDSDEHGGDDCDDTRADTHPGATDIPNDAYDQDCMDGPLICEWGDSTCPVNDCTTLQRLNPEATTGSYFLTPGGALRTTAWCEMELDDGGWTLAMIMADDDVDKWTHSLGVIYFSDSTERIGSASTHTRDYRLGAVRGLPMKELLFIHRPSGVWATYTLTDDDDETLGYWMDDHMFAKRCYGTTTGFPMTRGTLAKSGALCDTSLYINPRNQRGTSTCSTGTTRYGDAWGFAWSASLTNGCPLDWPSSSGGVGPDVSSFNNELNARGFGAALDLNTGEPGTGENRIEVYARP